MSSAAASKRSSLSRAARSIPENALTALTGGEVSGPLVPVAGDHTFRNTRSLRVTSSVREEPGADRRGRGRDKANGRLADYSATRAGALLHAQPSMTCRGCNFRCVAKGVVTLFATPRLQKPVDGNRAQRARFPVPGADSASRFLRRDAPSFALRPQGCQFASELAYHSRAAHSREPILSEGPLCCALFGRDCKSTLGALTRSAWTEIPSPPVWHRICSAEFRRLARSSGQVVALPRLPSLSW